jgi:hypothetical protein
MKELLMTILLLLVFSVSAIAVEQDGYYLNKADYNSAKAYLKFKKIKAEFFPSGIPNYYGEELGVSFDKVQHSINVLKVFDPIITNLSKEHLGSYIWVTNSISCEYCCKVPAITRFDGASACKCAHSKMMRGLAAYLTVTHPEVSKEYILEELQLWKRQFFPKKTMMAQLENMLLSGDEVATEVLEEFPEFLSDMVGGC